MPQTLTQKRDLLSGKPLWKARRTPRVAHSPLSRSISCEVLVIGAGISGAIIAQSLTEAGFKVVIVDRRDVLTGSTAASTAMLQYEIDTPLCDLSDQIGRDRAERVWRRSRMAVDALRERSERLGIKADQATRASIYLDGNVLDAAGLEREYEARRRAGFEVELLKPAAVKDRYGISRRHAIIGYGNYSADPRRLAAGFLNAAIAEGARLYTPVEIADVVPARDGATALTANGQEIRADHVVFATGYETLKGVPKMGNTIISSWTIATAPQPRNIWPSAAIIWEASDPYLYIRTTPQGHVICGGEDAEIADADERDQLLAAKTRTLTRKLGQLLPMIDPMPAYAWTGAFGNSPTGTPTIGRVPGMENCYAALGYGGNGITFSMMAAQMLVGLITGLGDPDSDLVSFSRKF